MPASISLKVTVLGSGTGIPSARRGSPALLVQSESATILMDSGPGTLRQLARIGLEPADLDTILYTHFHPDHTLDFLALCFALRNPDIKPPPKPIRVLAAEGFLRLWEGLSLGYGRWIEPPRGAVEICELPAAPGATPLTSELMLRHYPLNHTPTSLGFRIESSQGLNMAYTGDTDECDALFDLGRDCDLFIMECSFPENRKHRGHLTPSLAGMAAEKARARRLVLTHFYPVCEGTGVIEACRKYYSGPVVMAEDFMSFVL